MFKHLRFKLLRKKTYDLRDKVLDVVLLVDKDLITVEDAVEEYKNLDSELSKLEILSDNLCARYPDMEFVATHRLNRVNKAMDELSGAIKKIKSSSIEK